MGPPARSSAAAIGALLKSTDRRERFQAAEALARLGPDAGGALPALIEQLGDLGKIGPNPVLVALGRLGPEAKPALPALRKLLETADDFHIKELLNAIGAIGPEAREAVPALAARLGGGDSSTQAYAARALGRIGPEARAATTALQERLSDKDRGVRVWAAVALARITGEVKTYVPKLVELWKDDPPGEDLSAGLVRFAVAEAFELLGAEARPARDLLLDSLKDPQAGLGTQLRAARALGGMPDDAAVIVPKLTALLELKGKPFERAERCKCVAEALGLLGPRARDAAPALRRLLEDDDNQIVDAAEQALEKIEAR
jgi:HEAT repeat protein